MDNTNKPSRQKDHTIQKRKDRLLDRLDTSRLKKLTITEAAIDERVLFVKKRVCPICKAEVKGRYGKKFCSVKCKSYYHKRLRQVTRDVAHDIDKILHRNRSILLEIMGKRKRQITIARIELSKRKFNFKHITHYIKNKQGKIYHYVYDFAWMEFSKDEVMIVRRSKK